MGRALSLGGVLALVVLSTLGAAGLPELGLPAALPEAGPGPGVQQTCVIEQTLASQDGLAPVATGAALTVDGSGFNCYQLTVRPEFPFHGHIRNEFRDVNGVTAFFDFEVLLLTVTPETRVEFIPPLQLGPGMTFTVIVNSNLLPVGIGTWEAGVDVGHVA